MKRYFFTPFTGNLRLEPLYQNYLRYIIYNEGKADFSVLMQDEMIKEIKTVEMELTKDQISSASADAEKLLGRKLEELYENSL